LGEYGFGGIGTPDLVTSSFIDVYESYVKAKNLYKEKVGHLPENGSECQFAVEEVDESELEAAYSIAKVQGFLPPPLMQRVFEFTMHMNAFFMAALRD
jgi:hypothetical protein